MSKKRPRPATRATIAKNLKTLMDMTGIKQHDLAAKSGVSQRQISNILSGSTSCSIETAEALGVAFNLTGWHLLIPDLPDALINSQAVGKLISAYIHAPEGARHYIDEIAEREAKYTANGK